MVVQFPFHALASGQHVDNGQARGVAHELGPRLDEAEEGAELSRVAEDKRIGVISAEPPQKLCVEVVKNGNRRQFVNEVSLLSVQ